MKKTLLVFAFAFALIVSAFVFAYRPARTVRPMTEDYTAWQHSLGTEVALATNGLGVSAATGRVGSFISYRAGVAMNSETISKLNTFETTFQNGGVAGFTRAELKSVINQQWMDIMTAQNALYITYMGNVWRVLPDAQSGVVQPRSNVAPMPASAWSQFASDYKNNVSGTDGGYARSQTATQLNAQIDGMLDFYGAGVTSWNVTAYSPTQAFLLAYAVLIDEPLGGNSTDMATQIQNAENWLYTNKGIARSSSGRKPYGVNGYLRSSPADVLFPASVQNSLLDKLIALR